MRRSELVEVAILVVIVLLVILYDANHGWEVLGPFFSRRP